MVCGHGSVLLLEIGGVFVLCCRRGVVCWDGSFFCQNEHVCLAVLSHVWYMNIGQYCQ